MSDDDHLPPLSPQHTGGDAHYAETLLYDFAKFLTSLTLLVLGGVLSFAPRTRLAPPRSGRCC